MRLAITHTTRVEYDAPVTDGVMITRLGPLSDDDQHWERFELRATPYARVRSYVDGFGNPVHLITIAQPHEFLQVTTRGVVATRDAAPGTPPARPPRPLQPAERYDYLAPSRLVTFTPGLEMLAAPYRPSAPERAFASVRDLTAAVYDGFVYEPQVTTVTTTVADMLETRRGVCQDFAHVLIGLCRALEIPARYVSGYVVSDPLLPDTQPDVDPTLASHAWVEAYTPTHGWQGFDPTHNHLVGSGHVKMAIGRDYADVPPTRGTSRGSALERLSVRVQVDRLD